MKHLAITIVLMSCLTQLMAQGANISSLFKSNMSKADEAFHYLDYRTAQYYYLKELDKAPDNKQAQLRVAECYLKLDDSSSAESWLAALVDSVGTEPKVKLLYAEVLRKNGNYSEAKKWYQRILDNHGNMMGSALKLAFLKNIDYYQRNPELYEINSLVINSPQSEFSPQLKGNQLIFVSSRKQETMIQYQPSTAHNDDEVMLKYFEVPLDSIEISESVHPLAYGDLLKSKFHDGPLWFYSEKKKVVFTRNNPKNTSVKNGARLINLEIFFADCNADGTWANVQAFPFNSENYSVGHPTLNANGTSIYFASNMPGGFGKSDIYVSHLRDGKWSAPENLGPEVNTAEEEFYPYLHNDSTLFFASTGLGGFGGLDVYISYRQHGSFTNAVNMGAPLNSAHDDFSILIDDSGRKGYIASNRPEGLGLDDLYAFTSNYYFVTGSVYEHMDSAKTVLGASISVFNAEDNQTTNITSDENGEFKIDLLYDKNYTFTVKKDGYSQLEPLVYSTYSKGIGYDSIKLKLWKHELFVKGKIYSNESQSVIEGALVTITNTATGTQQSVQTGTDGVYAFLVYPNEKYRIDATNEGFLPEGYNLNTDNIYYGELLNDLVLEEVFVDKATVFFDVDKYRFSTEAYPELADILKTLKRFPKSTLNVTAHADSRGTVEYNQKLSDRRVATILNYFAANGINKFRMKGKGFGESLLLNTCSDGVDCGEDDHSKNRRAEIKVQTTAPPNEVQ
ncbi:MULTISPECIES: carboxypeptidase regulatory-like domain-containing protein [unclassified Imperialibacter]|uniref:carboxypeptidase regulatory-like domain-containing protein n=1 Tax=unclassified Imperialibacter TaxID=2629706 RepID=UPI00125A4BEA|nr:MULTISPECIES: carboxypeptidase regulatory-like domain-containing protein [unclassified Imperialibacter]CAD5252198.1 conserved exported hypothetical protein [Imperialibacter sp. 75]CAD5298266.1 conserved exported hypothetical protein [Imperialibacter sp. 89]VVT13549.1 putative Outer membrane protein OmpA [Imperialibacter sp. EC-SDR9]